MIIDSDRLDGRNTRRLIISLVAIFTIFGSVPEIHVVGFKVFADVGSAIGAKEINVWNSSACSASAAAWAFVFSALGTLAIYAFGTGLQWIALAKKATPLEFGAKALSIFLILLGILFWGMSIYIAGKCGYIYVSSLLF